MYSASLKTIFLYSVSIYFLIDVAKCDQCQNVSPYQYSISMVCTEVKDKFPTFTRIISNLKCVDCDFQTLTKDAFQKESRVEDLNFTGGHVSSISENALSLIGPSIHNIIFINTQLITVAPKVFSNFSYLDNIILTNNNISQLDGVFKKTNVSLLNLSYNRFTKLGTLTDQLRVTKLNLSHNSIVEIPENAFAAAIFWEGRQWKKLPQMLDLSYNLIEEINEKTFKSFVDADKLKQLYLQNNKISVIKNGSFLNFNKLSSLHLENNKITNLVQGSFNGLDTLDFLNLKKNNIKSILNGLFSNLPLLRELHLEENQLSTLSINTFSGLIQLNRLNLSYNPLTNFENDYIYPLGRLESLDISAIGISSLNLGDLLKHNFRLRSLIINDNFWTCQDLVTMYKLLNQKMLGFHLPSKHYDVPNLHGIACSRDVLDNYNDLTFDQFLNIISQDRVFEDLYDKRLTAENDIEKELSMITITDTLKSIHGIFYMVTIITIIVVIIFLQFVVRCLFRYLYWHKKLGNDKFSFMYARNQDNVELIN